MRKALIAGNWKMNKTVKETCETLKEMVKIDVPEDVDALICPPFTSLESANRILKGSKIIIGAQNVSEYEDGARTGEISTTMLKDLDVEYVILGHSERRTYYRESNEIINNKIKRVLKENLKVILCVGEEADDREKNRHEEVVREELLRSLRGIKDSENIVVAYEPIWAIGTGKTCNKEDAEDMCKFIRENMAEIFSGKEADNMRILYGGSVKPANVKELMSMENIDGALVGGASLKADDFGKLVNFGE